MNVAYSTALFSGYNHVNTPFFIYSCEKKNMKSFGSKKLINSFARLGRGMKLWSLLPYAIRNCDEQ